MALPWRRIADEPNRDGRIVRERACTRITLLDAPQAVVSAAGDLPYATGDTLSSPGTARIDVRGD